MFCPKCGASIGIDFRQVLDPHRYGISVSSFFILTSFLPDISPTNPLRPFACRCGASVYKRAGEMGLYSRRTLYTVSLPPPLFSLPVSPTLIHTYIYPLSRRPGARSHKLISSLFRRPVGPRHLRDRRWQAGLQVWRRNAGGAAGGGSVGPILGRGEAGDEVEQSNCPVRLRVGGGVRWRLFVSSRPV